MRSYYAERRIPNTEISLKKRLSWLWHDPVSGPGLRFSWIFCLILLGIIVVFYWRLPSEIPLTYSRPWGAEQLVSSFFLFFVFFITLAIVVVNSLLASFFLLTEQLLARMLVWIATLVAFIIDITVLRVVLLIT